MKSPRVYLQHIQQCLSRIEAYTSGGRDSYRASTLIQDAVLRNLQTIGQSVSRLPASAKNRHPEIPWQSVIAFRNVLVHDYLGVSVERVWDIVENDLPRLKAVIEAMLSEPEPES